LGFSKPSAFDKIDGSKSEGSKIVDKIVAEKEKDNPAVEVQKATPDKTT
jgi:hypothetical protein